MAVSTLICSECGAVFQVRAPASEFLQITCKFCGGSLSDLGAWGDSTAVEDPDAPVEVVVEHKPYRFLSYSLLQVAPDTDLGNRVAVAAEEGTPSAISTRRHRAVLLSLGELRRLVQTDVTVNVERQRTPDGWLLQLETLVAHAHAWTFREAADDLLAHVRTRIREVLSEPMTPTPQRNLALLLWLADAEGRLQQVLDEALVTDDYDEQGPEAGE